MGQISPAELDALNILRQAAVNAGVQLQRMEAAVNAYLKVLGNQYGGEIDYNTGEIKPKPKVD